MARVVIVGGGWSGCAAALTAAKAGADVVLLERTDMLLGTGLVGGIMRNNGRYTAAEEMIALGGGELFEATDRVALHKHINFPHHSHASLYDVTKIEPEVRRILYDAGVDVRLRSRMTSVRMDGNRVRAVADYGTEPLVADVFVDTTGTAGPPGGCERYGKGCMMCVLRCHTFGGRVGLTALAGVQELQATNSTGKVGAISGSVELAKESVDPALIAELEETGMLLVSLPDHLRDANKLTLKACQQYAEPEFADNLVILDTGHPKVMVPYMDLDKLRQVPGFQRARFIDPYSGGMANSVRYLGMAPRDDTLKVDGVDNLFCAGEKAGPLVGHTEAIATGTLAGHNAVRHALGLAPVVLPTTLAVGDAISWMTERLGKPGGVSKKYTFSGSIYFERMVKLGLYTTDREIIRQRVEQAGLTGLFAHRLSAEEHVS